MLSTEDLERLITVKRREIEKEKTALGLSSPDMSNHGVNKENAAEPTSKKQVRIATSPVLCERNDANEENKEERDSERRLYELEERIPPGLERYIRRYIGLPVMLKAGEYSPNNPLTRGERSSGDVLVGLGEYERRRNTLRKLRQQQYREYLDQQAKKKQDAKEQAERERREREERERLREEERERAKRIEHEKNQEQRRASVCYVSSIDSGPGIRKKRVDTGVQVGISRPLSVAVQTDDDELYRLSPSPTKSQLTQAERELSPRTVVDSHDDRPIQPAPWAVRDKWSEGEDKWEKKWEGQDSDKWSDDKAERRRSYGDFDERSSSITKRSNREKLVSDLRHTYMPSIFDADAIRMRNLQAEKEAAARRQFYQQELKNQILEQQRIREERKTREKMLEAAEMRRLEEQLRMLRAAQDREVGRHHDLSAAMKESAVDYERKRNTLQNEIDIEQQKLHRASSQPSHSIVKRNTATSRSDTTHSKLPFYYPRNDNHETRKPFSTNIPDNSIFSPNYDVENYLRRNLNPTKESLMSNRLDKTDCNYSIDIEKIGKESGIDGCEKKVIVEKAIVHERPKDRAKNINRPKYEPSFLRNLDEISQDETPIPVLRHSPKDERKGEVGDEEVSEAMKLVEDKWKVPAVQKNILKSLPNDEGKSVNILTQLGSIRRQLQLEQLKLDNMISKNNV